MFAKVCFTGFAVAALALAQGPGSGGGMGGGGRGGGMGDSGGMGGGQTGGGGGSHQQKENRADQIVNRLKLSSDQKSEFVTIMQATVKDADPILHQVLQSRQNLANAMLSSKSDADLAPLIQALNDAQFQMTGVEVKTFQKIVGILKPNQVAKAPEAFDLMTDIFLPPPASRGRGR